jgi:hypothetical protein
MKPIAASISLAILLAGSVLLAGSLQARDQELQAALQKLGCVPSRILPTTLSSTLIAYEVTCKGKSEAVYIVCRESECRPQPRSRDDDDR